MILRNPKRHVSASASQHHKSRIETNALNWAGMFANQRTNGGAGFSAPTVNFSID